MFLSHKRLFLNMKRGQAWILFAALLIVIIVAGYVLWKTTPESNMSDQPAIYKPQPQQTRTEPFTPPEVPKPQPPILPAESQRVPQGQQTIQKLEPYGPYTGVLLVIAFIVGIVWFVTRESPKTEHLPERISPTIPESLPVASRTSERKTFKEPIHETEPKEIIDMKAIEDTLKSMEDERVCAEDVLAQIRLISDEGDISEYERNLRYKAQVERLKELRFHIDEESALDELDRIGEIVDQVESEPGRYDHSVVRKIPDYKARHASLVAYFTAEGFRKIEP